MPSIYHFFSHLVANKSKLLKISKLGDFPFDQDLLSCKNDAIFPDMAIRINEPQDIFTGGELIELKDSKSYTIASFNSTIPTGRKPIQKIAGEHPSIREQMEKAGDDINTLPIRDVFYLVRGRQRGNAKVCLIHGNFFETVSVNELIKQSFSQVIEERRKASGVEISQETLDEFLSILAEQESFSKTREVKKASVKLRFRIMTEVQAEGNILNSKQYPQIEDNTLNFAIPCHDENTEKDIRHKMIVALGEKQLKAFDVFKIKHHRNGEFLVFQTKLK